MQETIEPRPFDGGHVAQVVVEYTGPRGGTFTIRGRGSGRPYRFAASPHDRRKFVLEEDLEIFALLADFVVLDHTRIRPPSALDELRHELDTLRATVDAQNQPRATPVSRRGGRPRIPLEVHREMWHGYRHALPPLSARALGDQFLEAGQYADPAATVRTRMSRFKRNYPELTREEDCPYCLGDFA